MAASFGQDGAPPEALDFHSTEEISEFLKDVFAEQAKSSTHPLKDAIASFVQGRAEVEKTTHVENEKNSSLVLNANPKYLSVAMLYRDHIEQASTEFLDSPDPGTGIPPRFWLEFINSLLVELPNSMVAVRKLVGKASDLKSRLAGSVEFPEAW